MDRKALCPCGSGRRYKSCCYPRDREREALVDAAAAATARVDAAVRVSLPLAEAAGGEAVACGVGCNDCCRHYIPATLAEATAIAEWLARPEQAEARAAFEAALPAWREAMGREAAALDEVIAPGGVPLVPGPAFDRYAAGAMAWDARAALCIFNRADGSCGIYPVRPVTCRRWHALGDRALCRPDSPEPAHVVEHPVLDGATAEAETALLAASRRSGRPVALSLANAVAYALAMLRR